PPRDLDRRPHGPAESIAVSAFVLAEGRPIGRLAERYVTELGADLAERPGLAPGATSSAQAAHVDRIAARRGETVRAAALLERARIAGGGATAADALALAREAHALRERLLNRTNRTEDE